MHGPLSRSALCHASASRSPSIVDTRAGPLQHLVRTVSALDHAATKRKHGTFARRASAGCRASPRWVSTCCTCRRFIRSASSFARARTTRVTAEPGDVGSPWAIGCARMAGTRRSFRELGTLDDFHALRRRGRDRRHRRGARHRLSVLARPSLRERASRVVPPAAGRHDSICREPAEEVSGHLSVRLRDDRLAGAVARTDGRVPVLVRAGRARVPRRQPAHQGAAVLGVLHRRGEGASIPRRSFSPRRSRGPRSCIAWRSWASRSRTRTSPGGTRSRNSSST